MTVEPIPTHWRFKDLTGLSFDRWTVLSYAGKKGKVPYWNCICACGNTGVICGWSLNKGDSQSCGCNHREDLLGQVFGRMTVIAFIGTKQYGTKSLNGGPCQWLCRCDCGEEKIVFANALKSGRTQSCGAHRMEDPAYDLTGRVFDRVTVIGRAPRDSKMRPKWACICSCGTSFTARGSHLQDGNIRSCGCLQRESTAVRAYKHGLAYTAAYRQAASNLRRQRKRAVDEASYWTAEMVVCLLAFQPCCVVCGSPDELHIDHVLPLSAGHALRPGNAVVLCKPCNGRKHAKSLSDLPPATAICRASLEFQRSWETQAEASPALLVG